MTASNISEGEEKVGTANVVNLDALIPREDLAIKDQAAPAGTVDRISIPHLNGFVFAPDLRKPHFQRETNQWTPKKVVELVTAFVDSDLIPAVILWRAGHYIFVIDGAHRLSALLAWINNDYGDGKRSNDFCGGLIPDEQRKVAEKTRKMVNKAVGSFSDYEEARKGVPKEKYIMDRLAKLSDSNVIAQWVPTTDPKSAEDSFFKINQAATPIDPTEKRLLKARDSASAISARAITNGGRGHKYWGSFGNVIQAQIENAAKSIHQELYAPPISNIPINTLDVPVAGQGYNALPFVFDLVNTVNEIEIADTTTKKGVNETLPVDTDGNLSLAYLAKVKATIAKITTDNPKSLGLHPVVYFYTRGGAFKPEAFFGAMKFIDEIESKNWFKKFQAIRSVFEDYLVDHKEAIALIVHRFGTGNRSIPWVHAYYKFLFEKFDDRMTPEKVTAELGQNAEFKFLTVPPPPPKQSASGKPMNFSSNTKTAAYFAQALAGCVRCKICGARVHKNSMHIDHATAKKDGGHSGLENAQVTHPYCDSSKG